MASIKATLVKGYPFKITTEAHGFITVKSAEEMASEWMRFRVKPFTDASGLVCDHPFGKVDVYDDDGNYVTTAWGE